MNKALIIIDMQNDFVTEKGKLPVSNAMKIVGTINRLRNSAHKNNIPVIYTTDWHKKDDIEFKDWPEHCIENSYGAEVIFELQPKEGDYIISKNKFSAFSNNRMLSLLKELKIDEVYVTGVATEYCVGAFLFDSTDFITNNYLVVDAIKGVGEIPDVKETIGQLENALIVLGLLGVKPVYTEDVIKEFEKEGVYLKQRVKRRRWYE